MQNRLLPRQIGNHFAAQGPGLWLFGFLLLMKGLQSLAIFFSGNSIVKGADGVPLDAFPPDAARTIVAASAISSLYRLLLCMIGVLALIRYRGIIALLFAVFAFEYVAKLLILRFLPLASSGGTPPGPIVNFAIFVIAVVGLVLSLWRRHGPQGT